MITTKGDDVFISEDLTKIRIESDDESIRITLETALGWGANFVFRRSDPDLKELAEALLASCAGGGA